MNQVVSLPTGTASEYTSGDSSSSPLLTVQILDPKPSCSLQAFCRHMIVELQNHTHQKVDWKILSCDGECLTFEWKIEKGVFAAKEVCSIMDKQDCFLVLRLTENKGS